MIECQLQRLAQKIDRKTELETLLPQWKAEHRELQLLTQTLHTAMIQEQNDVQKLEAGGIGTVFHKLTGRMEEKLDKERQEAETASNEYLCASARLEEITAKIADGESELESLADCKSEYLQVMQDRVTQLENDLQNTDDPDSGDVLKVRLQLERRRKSLREALLESGEAARAAQKNLEILLPANIIPAESNAETVPSEAVLYPQILLEEITDLQAKLAQMGIDPEPHLTIDSYLRAPAVFLARTESNFPDKIQLEKAMDQIRDLQNQISSLDDKLRQALSQIEEKLTN